MKISFCTSYLGPRNVLGGSVSLETSQLARPGDGVVRGAGAAAEDVGTASRPGCGRTLALL
jgi:hypothetical protein